MAFDKELYGYQETSLITISKVFFPNPLAMTILERRSK